MRISWPYDCRCSMQIFRLASYAGTPVECVVAHDQGGAQAIQVPNCTTGNCSSHKIKALLNGNAIYVKLLSQFTGYSSAGKQSKPGRRPCGQQDSGRPQF